MLVEAQDEVSEAQIIVISESQPSNSLMTPRDQLASPKSHSKALSTGKSDIGAASMVFNVESYEKVRLEILRFPPKNLRGSRLFP